jgi:cryptochrome
MTSVLHWFRKGLRVHDNEALIRAAENASHLYCVFILDPWYADERKVGTNRYGYLLQSLTDLDQSLRKLGSKLFVVKGSVNNVMPILLDHWKIKLMTWEIDTEPYALVRDTDMEKLASSRDIKVQKFNGHTLYNIADVITAAGGNEKVPRNYNSFLNLVNGKKFPISQPFPAPTSLPGYADTLSSVYDYKDGVPTLEEMGYDPKKHTTNFVGGETHALMMMKEKLKNANWVASFDKPSTSPSSIEPSTTTLSPALKFGTLSSRLFYHEIMDKIKSSDVKTPTSPPTSLIGQLMWREFFYTQAMSTPNFGSATKNPYCKKVWWELDPEIVQTRLAAWESGNTGYPWIDASMRQLKEVGWIHHLQRHSVSCFLTRGDLFLSWERGVEVFDRLLVDADYSMNTGNWLWTSASCFFYQYFRVYSPISFAKKTDPNGDYIRKWLPKFASFPAKYIYEPWNAPIDVQRQHNLIVGVDYPHRIVDHDKVKDDNMRRMAEGYARSQSEAENGKQVDSFQIGNVRLEKEVEEKLLKEMVVSEMEKVDRTDVVVPKQKRIDSMFTEQKEKSSKKRKVV